MKKIITILLSLLILFTVITSCQNIDKNNQKNDNENPKVETHLSIVTTIFPQYDFTRQIVGDLAEVHMLLKPGAESHSYEPTPQDIKLIQNSDLFIYVGGENDTWIEGIIESMGEQAPDTMRLIDLVDTLDEDIVEGMQHKHENNNNEETENDKADEHDHELDEHVWTSPIKAIEIVKKITEVLSKKDPVNANVFQTNSENYIEDLETLDQEFRDIVKNAKRKTILVADRFPFRYLVEEYGIDYYAAFTGCSTDTEASAATVAFLINKTNELQLPYIFSIELSNEKIANSIVESTNAKKLTLHSIHNLSKEELAEGETYISLMQKNAKNLAKALQE